MLYSLDCVSQDYVEAARLFKLAADQSFPEAEYELAFCYYSGQGLKYDLAKVSFVLCANRVIIIIIIYDSNVLSFW